MFWDFCAQNTQKGNRTLKTLLPTICGGWWWKKFNWNYVGFGGVGGGVVAYKNKDKDAEKDLDENKDLMKDNSV